MIRNPALFTTSLLLLASAASLAGILIHDGEVGTDEARLAYAGAGDGVKVKGSLAEFAMPADATWSEIRELTHHNTFELTVEDVEAVVLVTGLGEVLSDDVVIEGAIVYNGPHPSGEGHLLLVNADLVTEPFFDW